MLQVLRLLKKMEDHCGIAKTFDCEVDLINTITCAFYNKLTAETAWASVPKEKQGLVNTHAKKSQ